MIAINSSLVTNVFLVHEFGGGSTAFGLLGGAIGLGYLVGSLLAGRVRPKREWPWIVRGIVAVALGWAVVAVTPWVAGVFVAIFVATAMDSLGGVASYSLVQRRIHDSVRGRVLSTFDLVMTIANLIGFAFSGVAVGLIGSRGVYAVGAVLCACSAA